LESQNKSLLEDKEDLDEQSKKSTTVSSIDIIISNEKELRDRLITHQLEDLIKKEINHIIGQDVDAIAKTDKLLIATIENKTFPIDDFKYTFIVQRLIIINQKIELTIKADVSG